MYVFRSTCLLVVALGVSVVAFADTFVDSFDSGPKSGCWTFGMTSPGLYSIDTSQGDVRFKTIGTNPGGYQDARAMLEMGAIGGPVAGDFEFQVDFHDAVIAGGGLNQVELHASFEDGSIFYCVRDGSNVHIWTNSYRGSFSTTALAGTFKIKRTGSYVGGYLNNQLIDGFGFTTSRLIAAWFTLQNNSGSNDRLSVIYDNFSISGAKVSPGPTSIAGKVELLDFGGDYSAQKVDFELVSTSGGESITVSGVPLTASGEFAFAAAGLGDYRVFTKGSHFLRGIQPSTLALNGMSQTLPPISLVNGDVDGDNAVTVLDYNLLSAAFDSAAGDSNWDPNADLDGDGAVTVFDYNILSGNFDLSGE
jgi:hypothetical protein